ncbi:putative cytochrome c oxidase subunit VIIc [Lyophyllum shimeji]|uniref:Cytochrome c oxidase subunit 8, mitochondrial n=1 Tax=Lyophyllum shimeji TaxID=47721 RepID=A0A9P3UI45_LYOSH|nr:putative cytochrome c oxidase subunit VIIc [Lyophyllum shimeji]
MSLSILARSSALRQQALARARSFHTTAVARSEEHAHYHHLPFQFPGEKKGIFAAKLIAFLGTGFAIPFLAAKWQLHKSQASS